ncbi:MAG: FeoA family protein [Oscillospiraceae bacterium]
MALSEVMTGEQMTVTKVDSDVKTQRFLQNIGLMSGVSVRIVSRVGKNLIISVKNTRLAMDKSLAQAIFVS